LKLTTPLHQPGCLPGFPRLRRRGPIEANHALAPARMPARVSTPEEAWPH